MSRLTKRIRLVLISSSLALTGCERNPGADPDCRQRPPGDGKQLPSACGPVDGQSGAHGTGHCDYGRPFWGGSGSSFGGNGASRGAMGHAGAVSSRGGFGSFGHGVGS